LHTQVAVRSIDHPVVRQRMQVGRHLEKWLGERDERRKNRRAEKGNLVVPALWTARAQDAHEQNAQAAHAQSNAQRVEDLGRVTGCHACYHQQGADDCAGDEAAFELTPRRTQHHGDQEGADHG